MISHETAITELEKFGVAATVILGRDFRATNQQMLKAFFTQAKQATGKWVHGGYRWHAYSLGHQEALKGEAAASTYTEQDATHFFVLYEDADFLFNCTAASLPDLRPLKNDIYIFPHSIAWLYSMTHERGYGPYFATSGA